ncbi:MAG: hypothetical protein ACQERN_08145 [Thermodesulfobacteriota bacterium]
MMKQSESIHAAIEFPQNNASQTMTGQWQMARNRLIGYLDALDVPPAKAMELTRQALDLARARHRPGETGPPVVEAMRQLGPLLAEQKQMEPPFASARPKHNDGFPVFRPAPTLIPGCMRSQYLELYPGQKQFRYLSETIDLRRSAPYMLLGLVLTAMYLMI